MRIDAGFTGNTTLAALEDADIEYVGRLKSNTVLQQAAAPYLKRPVGRPPNHLREWCYDISYQAASWKSPRRVILVICERPDDLFLDYFFLVTNLSWMEWAPDAILALYRKRGKAEGHMGELKNTLNVHLSSTCRGASTVQNVMGRNQVSLLLSLYAYQLMHSLRVLMEQVTKQGWSIRKLREQVLKVAASVTVHARRITIHIGQSGDKWWSSLLKHLPWLKQVTI